MTNRTDKSELRKIIRKKLEINAPLRNEKSSLIWNTLTKMENFRYARQSGQLMVYLDFDSEVQTTLFLTDEPDWTNGLIIPYCRFDEILAVRVFSLDELAPQTFGILEPKQDITTDPQRLVSPEEIAFVLVPGLAFDRQGNRLGRGKGYYDRFLRKIPPETFTAGLAFECQIVEQIPVCAHDEPVSMVITETG
ncbi:MAG: 5-formyltetrahydrofolate cyclo-ligase [Planctomycetaceae bacterium]|jgi:5-formyltetrahydrofolate cyclo-ligase|nr:5-formyltetrahydrofolate cyclo-ligase [Planctomycetaceae bacterium]